MKIIQNILTKSDCYKTGQKIKVKGLMLHSVGCPQPSANVFMNTWNRSGWNVCAHALIDGNTGQVYQTLPWNHRGWHGGGSSNNTHIGVEMGEPATIKYTGGAYFTDNDPVKTKETVIRTYNSAVELFALLCKEYGLDPIADGVIVSHSEGHKRGIASAHADPEHLWNKFGLTMEGFRIAVQERLKQEEVTTSPTPEKPTEGEFEPYRVSVESGVDIHSAPAVSQIKTKGVYTIVKEQNGYGKLKSGAGWIKLSEVKKV